MSDEAAFRRLFVSSLRPHCLCEYMSSMNKVGVPDIHIVHRGRAVWPELKFVTSWPKSREANVLHHRFSGPQLTFLKRVDAQGGLGLGVVGFRDGKKWKCVALRQWNIRHDGTVTKSEIERHRVMSFDNGFALTFLTILERA